MMNFGNKIKYIYIYKAIIIQFVIISPVFRKFYFRLRPRDNMF